ncbi:murein hydrolase activator EnvC family protein [Caenibacillus caldisaponilyticus]|uniref:murein hydrolase activator EnvC family protein n=1 Tax=Caenibacillus caldisaponilyticus TaxID=1674942 RepID=UPI001300D1DA|nr:peptidoglycan DD-metalloendopeptidase family protein [Caenibacillus caldisaponilyticus]
MKQKVNEIEKKQEQNQNEINRTKDQLNENRSKQKNINDEIADLDHEIQSTTDKIQAKQDDISRTKTQIEALKKDIADTKVRIAERDKLLKERVRSMYINGGSIDYLQVLLGAKSFGDFVTRVLALNTIVDQDKRILNAQKADKARLEAKETQVESQLADLQKDYADLRALQQSLADKKAQHKALLAQLKEDEKHLEKLVMSKQEIAENLAAQKAAAQKAYELWKQEQSNKHKTHRVDGVSGGGTSNVHHGKGLFIWPTSGAISSGFGPRDGGFHSGIDIAAKEGTPVVAAASGVVARSYRSSSYGECIFISHYINGQQYTTVYAHMEKRLVQNGQTVSAGQVIGYVGSTGESTGFHLHFEVYIGAWRAAPTEGAKHPGSVNPLNYLP